MLSPPWRVLMLVVGSLGPSSVLGYITVDYKPGAEPQFIRDGFGEQACDDTYVLNTLEVPYAGKDISTWVAPYGPHQTLWSLPPKSDPAERWKNYWFLMSNDADESKRAPVYGAVFGDFNINGYKYTFLVTHIWSESLMKAVYDTKSFGDDQPTPFNATKMAEFIQHKERSKQFSSKKMHNLWYLSLDWAMQCLKQHIERPEEYLFLGFHDRVVPRYKPREVFARSPPSTDCA